MYNMSVGVPRPMTHAAQQHQSNAEEEKEEEEEKEKEKQTKRPNAPGSQRVEEKEKVHTPDIVKKEEELDLQQGKEVLVVFRPVIW